MKITEALIERFLNNDCDEAERQAVKNYIIRHPEVLRRYMTDESWRAFEPHKELPEPVSAKMLSVIQKRTHYNRKAIIMHRWWAAAAVLLLLSGTYWYIGSNAALPEKQMAKRTIVQPQSLPGFRLTSNTTTKPLTFTLEDGTRVKLTPNSELTYPVPFPNDRRELNLKGQATFYVAKDASRPFTVYAGRLATTALGTVFRITAFSGKTTRVQLLSGKVRVKADSTVEMKGVNVAYLLPGQELKLNAQQFVVLNRKEKDKPNKPMNVVAGLSAAEPDSTVTMFHNEPLEQIFITLSQKYQTKISFRSNQLSGITFTGKYDHRKESLAVFIKTISLLNNLIIREENGEIIIESQ